MDPFSIGSSSAGVATLAGTLSKNIADCIEAVRTARAALEVLSKEVLSLEQTLRAVETTVKRIDLQNVLAKAGPAASKMQQATLSCMLKDCHKCLRDLAALVDGIKSHRLAVGPLETPVYAWRLSTKSPHLGRIQHLVKSYNDGIQIHLQMMQLLISVENSGSIQNIDESLASIKTDILTMRFQMQQFYDRQKTSDPDMETEQATFKEYLGSSETLLSSASEYYGSTAGTIPADHTVVDFPPSRVAHVEGWISDVHHSEDVETAFDDEDISELFRIADEHLERKEYADATPFFKKFLEDAQAYGEWDSNEILEARLKLGECHTANLQFSEAGELLRLIDQSGLSEEQRSDIEQRRAEVAFMLSDYTTAQQCAKRAVRSRSKGSDGFYNSRSLLAAISRQIGEAEYARMYAHRIPDDFVPTRIPGWIEPSEMRVLSAPEIDGHLAPLATPTVLSSSTSVTSPTSPTSVRSSTYSAFPSPSSNSSISMDPWPSPQPDSASAASTTTKLVGHTGQINTVSFSPDDERIVSASTDGTIRVWASQSGRLLETMPGEVGPMRFATYSPQGLAILSLSEDDHLQVWNSHYEQKFAPVPLKGHLVTAAWATSSSLLTSIESGRTCFRDDQTGEITRSARNEWKEWSTFNIAAISSSGNILATGSVSGSVTLWDMKSHKKLLGIGLREPFYGITSLAFSADERYFAASSADGYVWVWLVKSRKLTATISQGSVKQPNTCASALCFSADSRSLISGAKDNFIRLWDLESGKLQKRVHCDTPIRSISAAKDGERLVCGGDDGIVRIIDLSVDWGTGPGAPPRNKSTVDSRNEIPPRRFSLRKMMSS